MAKKVKNRAAAKDFTAEMLPHNRKQQFFNILKNRVPLILKSAIIIFAFFIPFILAASYKTVVVYGFYKQYSGGAISYENMLGYINYTEFLSSLVFVPCYRTEGIAPDYFEIDLSAAVENLLLEADYLGLGAVWMGIAPDEGRMNAVKEVLDIQEHLRAFALVPCGYPAEARAQQDRYEESRVHYV